MAKSQPKDKVDPLAISLKLLARADRDSARALRFLCKAILTPFPEPDLKACKFVYGKKKYSAKLTPDQCQTILKVVKENGNVLLTVTNLLGGFTKQVTGWIER